MAHTGVGDLADVDALVAVHADAVRGDELSDVQAVAEAEPFEHAARGGHDRDSRAYVGSVAVHGHAPAELADIDTLVVVYVDGAGPMHVVPNVFDASLAIEDLDAVILAVADVQVAVAVGGDVVDYVELARDLSQARPKT